MFIIGESLQNFPNIENAAVIKVDWQSVWMSLSLLWVLSSLQKTAAAALQW